MPPSSITPGSSSLAWPASVPAASDLLRRPFDNLFSQNDLSHVKGCVIGTAQQNREPIARRIFRKFLWRDRRVFLKPLCRGQRFEGRSKFTVDLDPGCF